MSFKAVFAALFLLLAGLASFPAQAQHGRRHYYHHHYYRRPVARRTVVRRTVVVPARPQPRRGVVVRARL